MTPGAVAFFVVVVLDDLDIQALASKLEAKSFCRSLAAPRHSCLKHRTLMHHNPIKSHNVYIHNKHQVLLIVADHSQHCTQKLQNSTHFCPQCNSNRKIDAINWNSTKEVRMHEKYWFIQIKNKIIPHRRSALLLNHNFCKQ